MNDFPAGDVVELRGGDGHRMVVEDVRVGIVYCVWVLNGEVVRGRFPSAVLRHAE